MNEQLPVMEIVPELKKILAENNTLILQAPPGAGKSTMLPLQLIHEKWLQGQKIIMLEPRRLAARSVALRMSDILGEKIGHTVGYRVRFDNKIGPQTKIEVVTEGILTRMLQSDNSLEGVGMVIFDEFHERSLHADLSLALCRELQQILKEGMRIMIMSATLDGETLSSLLDNAPILTSKGRQYPVTINNIPEEPGLPISTFMAKVIKKAYREETGDILAFFPGTGEINKTKALLEEQIFDASILPLYGDLPYEKQQEAILPSTSGKRKIILSTSVAETSLTIEGIKIVVDSGYSRTSKFDPKSGLTKLETVRITMDSADQRAGRAGRLGPGVCYRLWSEGSHRHLLPQRNPEILEADLTPLVLELAQWGADIKSLTWLTPPPAGAISQATGLLQNLGALENGKITEAGKEILKLPTHPRIAYMLLQGKKDNTLSLATDLAAVLEERDPLGKGAGADITLRIESLRQWRNGRKSNISGQLLERLERAAASWRAIFKISAENQMPDKYGTGLLLSAAYPERIARKKDHASYKLANSRSCRLPDQDPLILEEWLAVAHLDAGIGEGRIFLAAPVDPSDLNHLVTTKDYLSWDSSKGVLIARKEQRIGDIIINSSPLANLPEEKKVSILSEAIKKEEFKYLPWDDYIYKWQARVMSLKTWRPEEEWPDVSMNNLRESVDKWLAPYLPIVNKRDDLKKLNLKEILTGSLPWALQQKLEELAPENIKVPSGSMIPLAYFENGSTPVLAVRLQEMFGLLETPAINEGKTAVLLHLLSPGYKPVQVTQDLKSFWKNTYPAVRKELRVRYQKHHWPEDPWTAEAVRGAKKKY